MLLSKVLIGDQLVNGQFMIFMDAASRTKFLAQTECGLEINCISPDDVGDGVTPQSLKIEIPHFQIANEAIGQDGQSVSYTLTYSQDSVLKIGSDPTLRLTFVSDIGLTELLQSA